MNFLRSFLFPFSLLYGSVTFLRNKLYDLGWLPSKSYELPVIVVGNLTTGGTGKTPMIEFLANFLKEDHKIAILSRGYKRKTSGFLEVESSSTVAEVGDEPLQFKLKFPSVTVAVCEDRQLGIEKLKENVELILMDDAFQHRKVTPSFSILLTAFDNLYVDDWILPMGNLRESGSGARRADVVLVTKCPETTGLEEMDAIKKRLRPLPGQPVYFTKIVYGDNIMGSGDIRPLASLKNTEFTLVTGIANPDPLVTFLKGQGLYFTHRSFPDHHDFTKAELALMENENTILTTEKDFMRLKPHIQKPDLFYLPITIHFLKGAKTKFTDGILDHIHP